MLESAAMPWSKEIEKAILCFCMTTESQDAIKEVVSSVRPDYFYSQSHKIIFRSISDMVETGSAVDMPKVFENLSSDGHIEEAGGFEFISSLTDFGNSSVDYQGDCTLLKKYAMLRGIIKAGIATVNRAMLGMDAPEEISRSSIEFMQQLENELLADTSTTLERDNAVSMVSKLEKQSRATVMSGIPKLDSDLGGFRAGELIIIAAETGVGKTVFARQIRRETCSRGIHGLYCSGEMDGEQLSMREAAGRTGISQHKFRNPWEIHPEEFTKIMDYAACECDKCSVLSGNLTVSRINRATSAIKRKGTLGFIMVDYDELVDAPGKTDFEKQNAVARACKALAMANAVPVFLLSQLRKLQAGEKAEKPSRHRLFGGSAKANDASTILFIDRPYVRNLEGDDTESKVYIIKNRNGAVGHVPCRFNIARMRFTEDTTAQLYQMPTG